MSSLATQFCPPFFWLGELGCPPPNSPDFRRWIVSIRIWGANVTVKLCWSAAGHLAWASVSIPTIKIHWEPPLEGATFLEISPNNSNRGSWMMMFLFRVTFFFSSWMNLLGRILAAYTLVLFTNFNSKDHRKRWSGEGVWFLPKRHRPVLSVF